MEDNIYKEQENKPHDGERIVLLAAIVDSSGEAIISTTLEGVITSWNCAAESMYGYAADEVIGEPVSMLMALDRPQEKNESFDKIIQGAPINHYETMHRSKDGKPIHVSITVSPIHDPAGMLVGASSIARNIGERKSMALYKHKMQRELRQSREWLATTLRSIGDERALGEIVRAKQEWERTFDAVPDLIAILDNRHRVVRVNRAMAQRLGVEPGQCAGMACFQCVHGLESPPPFCPHALTLADGREHVAEVHENKLGGDFLVSTTPLFDQQGKVTGAVHVARDITEIKKTEERIAYLASFPQVNPNPILEVDRGGAIVFFNAATLEVLRKAGLEKKVDLFLPEDLDELLKALRDGKGSRVFNCEVKIGDRIFGESVYLPDKLEVLRIYTYDITEHRRAEDALRKSHEELELRVQERTADLEKQSEALRVEIEERKRAEECVAAERKRFNDVLELLPAYLVLLTPDYHVPFANRFFRERFGESHGKRCFEYLFQRSEPCDNCETYKVLKTNAPHRWEWTGPDGRDYDIYDFPFTDTDGANLIMEMGIDITERKQAEDALRKLNIDLGRYAEELSNANKELESFNYSVSHDLRAPLRSINGFSQIILNQYQDKLDEEGRDYLQIITSECKRMGLLIDDLLNLSRLSRKEISRESVDLSSMAEGIAAELQAGEPARQVDFVIAPGIKAYGDKVLLQSVLENLINNAWKFTGKHPHARIEFGVTAPTRYPGGHQDGDRTYFVRDDGAGFDMKYAHKLFGAFQRLHGVEEFPGNGIGLAIIQRIIRRHGGKVWAEGAVEKGAAFFFTLGRQSGGEKK